MESTHAKRNKARAYSLPDSLKQGSVVTPQAYVQNGGMLLSPLASHWINEDTLAGQYAAKHTPQTTTDSNTGSGIVCVDDHQEHVRQELDDFEREFRRAFQRDAFSTLTDASKLGSFTEPSEPEAQSLDPYLVSIPMT